MQLVIRLFFLHVVATLATKRETGQVVREKVRAPIQAVACLRGRNLLGERSTLRKIRAPIKIKSALPPPPPQNPKYPPLERGIYGHGFSCRTDAFFPGVHKIVAAISGPRIADKNFTDTRIFLIHMCCRTQ